MRLLRAEIRPTSIVFHRHPKEGCAHSLRASSFALWTLVIAHNSSLAAGIIRTSSGSRKRSREITYGEMIAKALLQLPSQQACLPCPARICSCLSRAAGRVLFRAPLHAASRIPSPAAQGSRTFSTTPRRSSPHTIALHPNAHRESLMIVVVRAVPPAPPLSSPRPPRWRLLEGRSSPHSFL